MFASIQLTNGQTITARARIDFYIAEYPPLPYRIYTLLTKVCWPLLGIGNLHLRLIDRMMRDAPLVCIAADGQVRYGASPSEVMSAKRWAHISMRGDRGGKRERSPFFVLSANPV